MTKQIVENGKLILELDAEEEKWLDEHLEKQDRLQRKQYQKEFYASTMTDNDPLYQTIIKDIREVFLKEYRKRWEEKWND